MEEIWKDIEGFSNYQVSNMGDVRNKKTRNKLRPNISEWGYKYVTLSDNGHNYTKYIHRTVAEAFIPNLDIKPQVNHIDGNKLNNLVDNLEWCTYSENNKHAYDTGLKKSSDKVRENAKKMGTDPKTRQAAFNRHPNIRIIETGEVFEANVDVAKRLGCNVQNVWGALHEKQHTVCGYHLEYVEKPKNRKPFLRDYQMDAVNRMQNGCILNGGVGSGKSRTGLYYYFSSYGGSIDPDYIAMVKPSDLYIITTAMKRDLLEWEAEMVPFNLTTNKDISRYDHTVVVDSWNNIKKYSEVKNSFFIFDEDRVTGNGAWVKAFLKIAKNNKWIILSATAGDTWLDYCPVFIANGFYKNRTEFNREHVIYSRFTKYPKVDRYINTGRLIRLRNKILIDMDFNRPTVAHHEDVYVQYDIRKYKDTGRTRWNPYTDKPIKNASELCYTWRKIVNTDESRQIALLELYEKHPKMIVFYNFDFERDILLNLYYGEGVEIAEWNGHAHMPVPEGDKWVYLVQYTAGCEGWNTIKTDTIVFYSQNYSYKVMTQAAGRIDRLNTKFVDLYYYHLKSRSGIDLAISKALREKKKFNETKFAKF